MRGGGRSQVCSEYRPFRYRSAVAAWVGKVGEFLRAQRWKAARARRKISKRRGPVIDGRRLGTTREGGYARTGYQTGRGGKYGLVARLLLLLLGPGATVTMLGKAVRASRWRDARTGIRAAPEARPGSACDTAVTAAAGTRAGRGVPQIVGVVLQWWGCLPNNWAFSMP